MYLRNNSGFISVLNKASAHDITFEQFDFTYCALEMIKLGFPWNVTCPGTLLHEENHELQQLQRSLSPSCFDPHSHPEMV